MPTAIAAKVIDASALAAIVFGEPQCDTVLEHVRNAHLIAPTLLMFELTNVCAVKLRRHPHLRETILRAFELATRYAIETQPVDHAAVLALAETTGLTAYDASYLWLARVLSAELVTLDGQLAAAAITLAR